VTWRGAGRRRQCSVQRPLDEPVMSLKGRAVERLCRCWPAAWGRSAAPGCDGGCEQQGHRSELSVWWAQGPGAGTHTGLNS
jgi:hypothetical protein